MIKYKDYLQSEHWKMTRKKALDFYGRECNRCGDKRYLNIHHKNYLNYGCEQMEDLEVVCKSCHQKIHDKKRTVPIPDKRGARQLRKEIKRLRSFVMRNYLSKEDADKMIEILNKQLLRHKANQKLK